MNSCTTYWVENWTQIQPIWEPSFQFSLKITETNSYETSSYSWENLGVWFSAQFSPNVIHDDSQFKNQIEN